MPTDPTDDDRFGYNHDEMERLGDQHRVWAEDNRRLLARAGFGNGATVLELGCGPGYTTLDLARAVGPGGRVIAVDRNEERSLPLLEERARAAGLSNIDARVAKLEALDLPAIAEAFVRAVAGEHGCNPEIGNLLPGLLRRAGLEVEISVNTKTVRATTPEWSWPDALFRNHTQALVDEDHLTRKVLDEFLAEWEARSRNPDAMFIGSPVMEVVGRRPPVSKDPAPAQ